jgi:hypothetical protein
LSGGHLEHPVGEGGELVAMGDGEDGKFPFVPKFPEDFEDFFLGQRIEIAGGFIQQEKGGFMLESPGQGNAALLSARKFIRKGVPTLSHAQTGEKFLGTGVGLMLGFAGKQFR